MTDPTPADVVGADTRKEEIAKARAAKLAADKAVATHAKAAKEAAEAEKVAEAAAKKAEGVAKKAPSPAATQQAIAARETATDKVQAAELAKEAAASTNEAKSKADAALAKLTNEELEASMPAEEWDEIVRQIERSCGKGSIVNGVVKPCKGIKKLNCAGPKPNEKARMDRAMLDAVNEDLGTSIDFDQLATWEGGQATEAYVPWFPADLKVTDGAVEVVTKRFKGTDVLDGASGSGVTIGTGVDLGQQESTSYIKRLRAAGISEELITRLTPYMGLKRSEACRYLRANPLQVTKEEADQIDKEMKGYHAKEAKKQYNNVAKDIGNAPTFDQLSSEEQTVLMSRNYHNGNLIVTSNDRLVRTMANRNSIDTVDALSTRYYGSAQAGRIAAERKYLDASYRIFPIPPETPAPQHWPTLPVYTPGG